MGSDSLKQGRGAEQVDGGRRLRREKEALTAAGAEEGVGQRGGRGRLDGEEGEGDFYGDGEDVSLARLFSTAISRKRDSAQNPHSCSQFLIFPNRTTKIESDIRELSDFETERRHFKLEPKELCPVGSGGIDSRSTWILLIQRVVGVGLMDLTRHFVLWKLEADSRRSGGIDAKGVRVSAEDAQTTSDPLDYELGDRRQGTVKARPIATMTKVVYEGCMVWYGRCRGRPHLASNLDFPPNPLRIRTKNSQLLPYQKNPSTLDNGAAVCISRKAQQMEETRNQRLSLLQAEKDLQSERSLLLSARLSNLRRLEQCCLVLEQRNAALSFQILAKKSEIDVVNAEYQTIAQQIRNMKNETSKLEEVEKERQRFYDEKTLEMKEFEDEVQRCVSLSSLEVKKLRNDVDDVRFLVLLRLLHFPNVI
ncbi:hypothetical protein ACLOJK_010830 [Asimina triloba]